MRHIQTDRYAYASQDWARAKPEAEISIQVSHVGGKEPTYLSYHLLLPRVHIST